MSALLLLVLAAPPLVEGLDGPPPPVAREGPAGARGELPAEWALSHGWLDSAKEAATLFASPGEGEPVGLACQVSFPDSFHLASVRLRTAGVRWELIDGDGVLYLPLVPTGPVRIAVYRDETHGKSVVGELLFGVLTAGMSLMRLSPTRVATLTVPARGGVAKQGVMAAACKQVRRSGLDAVLAARKPCQELRCLREEAALLGPEAAEVVARAQAVMDAKAEVAARWRREASWRLKAFTLEAVQHCGPGCVRLTVQNHTPFALTLPHVEEVLDAGGRPVQWLWKDFTPGLAAHQRKVLQARVKLDDASGPVRFPLALRVREDRWYQPVPGRFARGGAVYTFDASRCGEQHRVQLPVARQQFGPVEDPPDEVRFRSGHTNHLSLPFAFRAAGREEARGESTVYGWDGCEEVVAVSGAAKGSVYLLVP